MTRTGHYVSVVRSRSQYRLLLGPYDTAEQAVLMVDLGRRLAVNYDPWCQFDAFGTCSLTRRDDEVLPVGIFGKL